MPASYIRKFFLQYENIVKTPNADDLKTSRDDIENWNNRLFTQFLIYCFPVSFIAAIPGIYMSFKTGYPVIGVVDILCISLLVTSTFCYKLRLRNRKLIVVFLFYVLAIFLIANLGYIGPGVFYLFAITILTALIFPIRFTYVTIIVNTIILVLFAFLIYFKPFNSPLQNEYTVGSWIAFSSNLVFLSIVLVVLIHKMFSGLQSVITKKDQLKFKYKNIFENSPLPMWLFDTDSLCFLDVNEAAVAHYGYTKSEFLRMKITDIRPEEYVKGIEQVVRYHRNEKKFHSDNIVHIKKNGERINVKIESSLIEFNGYQAKLVLVTDVTAQIKSQAEIERSNNKVKQSESNLRAIFDNTTEGFILLDIDSRIMIFNSKARESLIFDKDKTEFETGRYIFDFVEAPRRQGFKELIKRVHAGGVVAYEKQYDAGTKAKWIAFNLTPVFEGGIIAGVCITGRDITDYKNYVQTIEQQNSALRDISWIQSHLVRAPLARIMGLISLLNVETCENEKEEMLKLLKISSDELDEIIMRITKKTSGVEKTPVEVH